MLHQKEVNENGSSDPMEGRYRSSPCRRVAPLSFRKAPHIPAMPDGMLHTDLSASAGNIPPTAYPAPYHPCSRLLWQSSLSPRRDGWRRHSKGRYAPHTSPTDRRHSPGWSRTLSSRRQAAMPLRHETSSMGSMNCVSPLGLNPQVGGLTHQGSSMPHSLTRVVIVNSFMVPYVLNCVHRWKPT